LDLEKKFAAYLHDLSHTVRAQGSNSQSSPSHRCLNFHNMFFFEKKASMQGTIFFFKKEIGTLTGA
jgi:hypothetical protein